MACLTTDRASQAEPNRDGPAIGVKEAAALVAPPEKRPSSTSLGFTNLGGLIKPVSLPLKGKGYEVLSHVRGRGTHFGTAALIDVIAAAAAHIASRYKGAVVSVGNLGFASGKKIPWSVSHQAGRDADIGMYALDAAGRSIGTLPFVRFDAAGEAIWRGQRIRFDTKRNLALVTFLISDPSFRIQYIFVARWLKEILLKAATQAGLSVGLRARLAETLHQPSDSSPHADHFHIRLFCNIDDRTYGCRDRGPRRDWVDMGDAVLEAYIAQLGRVLRLPKQEKIVLAAVKRLAIIGSPSGSPHLLEALTRPEKKVREAALKALTASQDPTAAAALVDRLELIADLDWLEDVLKAAALLADETLLDRVFALAAAPDKALHASLRKKTKSLNTGRSLVNSFVLRVLESHGLARRARAIQAALALATSPDKTVAKAADSALRMLTCRFPRDHHWARALSGATAVGDGGATDIAIGLRQIAPKLEKRVLSRAHVDALIGLIAHREAAVRGCVTRALKDLTGHDADARLRSPARNKRHWESWWRDNRASSPLRP